MTENLYGTLQQRHATVLTASLHREMRVINRRHTFSPCCMNEL